MNTIEELREPLRAFLNKELAPIETCETICAAALGRSNGQWPRLWLLWAALGARCGGNRATGTRAEAEMRQAAREWLDLTGEEADRRAYLERWLERLGGEATVGRPTRGTSRRRRSAGARAAVLGTVSKKRGQAIGAREDFGAESHGELGEWHR